MKDEINFESTQSTKKQGVGTSEIEVTRLLWTGGWDSTFRLVELSRMDITVEPVYVIDPKRASANREMEAMERILNALKAKSETKANILPILKIYLTDITPDEEISKAYKTIAIVTHLGSQHEWLAWLGKQYPGMEMGTEYADPSASHIIQTLYTYCSLYDDNGIKKVDCEKSSNEGRLVLGWFIYPIIDKTEPDMVKLIKEWGYEDVMKNIWFCHNPIKGKPCGLCHPCAVKMESGMEWLLPDKGRNHYHILKKLEKVIGKQWAARICRVVIGPHTLKR